MRKMFVYAKNIQWTERACKKILFPLTKLAMLKQMITVLPSSMVIVDRPMLYGPAPTAV